MKKSIFILVLLVGFLLLGCEKELMPIINVSDTSITIQVDDTHKINVELENVEGTPLINYEVSDKDVIEVVDGLVKGLKEGSTTITLSIEGYADLTKTIEVTVEKAPASISVEDEITLKVDGTHQLKVKLKNIEGTPVINYEVSDEDVIEVVDGLIKGLKVGSTTITLSVEGYPDLTKTIKVIVEKGLASIDVEDEVTLSVGETHQLEVELKNIEGTPVINYEVSDEELIEVVDGLIKGLKEGSATITLSVEGYPDLTKTIEVIVEKALASINVEDEVNMLIDSTHQLEVELVNIEGTPLISYEVSDEEIIEVSEAGLIKGLKKGEATINIKVAGYESLTKTIKVVVDVDLDNHLIIFAPETIYAGEEIQITYIDQLESPAGVMWDALDRTIAAISNDGKVRAIKEGVARFYLISLETALMVEFEIQVLTPAVESITIRPNIEGTEIKTTANYKLDIEVLPKTAVQGVLWSTNNDSIATIDENGFVKFVSFGEVTFTAKSIEDETITAAITVEFYWDVMDLLDYVIVENPVIQRNVTAVGYQFNYDVDVLGSVSNYYFGNYTAYEKIAPASNKNRPGEKMTSIEFITVHDTGSSAASAGAASHASYVYNGGGATSNSSGVSWHYSIGNDGVWLQIPEEERSFHAGDGSRVYKLNDTGVKATSYIKPDLAIDSAGYYTLNGERTIILAPKRPDGSISPTSDINDYGIYMEVGSNGNWMMNSSWWSESGYNRIGNFGGNRNSIGIETMVNQGSDLYLTWHYTAKKAAELANKHNLTLDRIVTHHHFSGKNCPQTMRNNGLYPNFRKMLEAEYLVDKFLKDYTFTFKSLNETLVDDTGRILQIPMKDTEVGFLITVENNKGFSQTKVYSSIIPAK